MKEKSGLGFALRRRIGAPVLQAAGEHPERMESLLMNATRLRIFIALHNSPCSHVRGLSRAVHVAPPSVQWHLGKLVEKGLVRSLDDGRRRIYYPANMLDDEDVALLSFLNQRKRAVAVRAVSERPGATQNELVRSCGCNSHTLRSLVDRGILDALKDGRHRRYYPADMFFGRKDDYERRARRHRQLLISTLAQEGLSPEVTDAGRGFMEIRVRLGTSMETLRLSRNPYDLAGC